jgi:hypothetical protein
LDGRNFSAIVLVGADSGSISGDDLKQTPTCRVDDRFANRLRPALPVAHEQLQGARCLSV